MKIMLSFTPTRCTQALVLAAALLMPAVRAQESPYGSAWLSADRLKSGTITLLAFMPVAEKLRDSIVKFEHEGKPIALGTIIDPNGLVLTKASEIKDINLTCKLADGREVDAELVTRDDENDLALVRVKATGLKPIEWASDRTEVGQWVVTPGVETAPEAVGIVSVPPRKIAHKRAFIGIQLDTNAPNARIMSLLAGFGAESAGLKPGDVILSVNGKSIADYQSLTATLIKYREGDTPKLRVRRDEQEFEASIKMQVSPAVPRRGPRDRQQIMNRMGGELSRRAEDFELAIQHDTVLQPWQCGGPILNLEGKAVGLNIARAGRIASYALPAELVKQIVAGWLNP